MQVSSFIGKPVLSPGGETYGYVTNVFLTRGFGKIACLAVADGEEEDIYLPMQTVRAVSDAVIAGRARLSAPKGIPSPVGRAAYSGGGSFLGTVSDVMLGDDPSLVVSGGNTADMVPVSLVSVMETVIVYASKEEKALAGRQSAKRGAARKKCASGKAEKGGREVPHRPGEEPSDTPDVLPPIKEPPVLPVPPVPKGDAGAPSSGIGDRMNLIGRYVQRPVYDGAGRLIAEAGCRITPALLSEVRRAGKLLSLAANTLTRA